MDFMESTGLERASIIHGFSDDSFVVENEYINVCFI